MKTLLVILIIGITFISWKSGWLSGDNTETEESSPNLVEIGIKETVNKLSQQKSIFAGIIGEFEKESNELETVLESGKSSLIDFKSAIQEARNKDAEFNKVYTNWESVENKVIRMRARFKQLVDGADTFYTVVGERAESIQDEKLRVESLAFIQKSQLAYAEQLKKTQQAIAQVDAMKVKVDDTMKALEIRFAVDVIDKRLGEMFEEIDSMIETVIASLKELEIESKQVLGSIG